MKDKLQLSAERWVVDSSSKNKPANFCQINSVPKYLTHVLFDELRKEIYSLIPRPQSSSLSFVLWRNTSVIRIEKMLDLTQCDPTRVWLGYLSKELSHTS